MAKMKNITKEELLSIGESMKKNQYGQDEEYNADKLLNMLDIEEKKQIRDHAKKQENREFEFGEDDDAYNSRKKKKMGKNLEDDLYEFSSENQKYEERNNDLYDALDMFEKAQELSDKKDVKKEKKEICF